MPLPIAQPLKPMNTPSSTPRLLWLGLCLVCLPLVAAEPAFRFEGGLVDGGVPANGTYDLSFELFAADTGGTSAGSHTDAAVEVVDGAYEVLLPFAPDLLDFNNRWIEVAARVSGATEDRVVLTPRLRLPAVPYASKAALADGVVPGSIGALELKAGAVTSGAIQSGAVTLEKLNLSGAGEGQAIVRRGSTANWESLNFWSLLGNAGTTAGVNFLGTTDAQPLEFRVNNLRGLILMPTAIGANIIAGSGNNQITAGSLAATISGGFANLVEANSGTVSGGQGNTAGGQASVVGGGAGNLASGTRAVVAGGSENQATGAASFLGGGQFQRSSDSFATVVGGLRNQVTNAYGFVGGGSYNLVGGPHAFVGGGQSNVASTLASVVAGGEANTGAGAYSVVGGGRANLAGGNDSVAGGGRENQATGTAATVAGGWLNEAPGSYAAIPGGVNNRASGFASLASGQSARAIHNGAFVWADSVGGDFASTGNNQFLVRAAGGMGIGTAEPQAALDVNGTVRAGALQLPAGAAAGRVLLSDADGLGSWQPLAVRIQASAGNPNLIGGANNVISNHAVGATISGGFSNRAGHDYATIAGGRDNRALGLGATVSGGRNNRAEGPSVTVAGGQQNTASDFGSTIAGGQQNTATGFVATIAGGLGNTASGQLTAISGGMANTASGNRATIGGGSINRASGDYSVSAGGNRNWATGDYSAVAGGDNNIAGEDHSAVGGGLFNTAAGLYSTVPGGLSNFALGEASQAAGQFAVAAHDGSYVWADGSSFARFGSTADNQYLIRAGGGVGIGVEDPQVALDVNGTIRSRVGGIEFPDGSVQETAAFADWSFADGMLQVASNQTFAISLGDQLAVRLVPNNVAANFIAGSAENTISSGVVAASVGGGWRNTVNATSGTVGGGQGNQAGGLASAIAGGANNRALGNRSVVGGGGDNLAAGVAATVSGGQFNTVTNTGAGGFIGGGFGNLISSGDAVVTGGRRNRASGANAFIGGGLSNRVTGSLAVVAGGIDNLAGGLRSVVAGGWENRADGSASAVGGGSQNQAAGRNSSVSGGEGNTASGPEAAVAGGWANEARGQFAAVPGGVFNRARGLASFAAGQSASALHDGAFVWADLSSGEFPSSAPNQFLIRAAGGVGVGVNDPQAALDVAGTIRSRSGGVEFPDGSRLRTAASFAGWSATQGSFAIADSAPFTVSVGDMVGLRLEPNGVAPNFIAGSAENTISSGVVAATVGGGWRNTVNGPAGTVGGGQGNRVQGPAGTVGGGNGNLAGGSRSVVGGGNENQALASNSAVLGGQFNVITNTGVGGFLGGGLGNQVAGANGALAGGQWNLVSGPSGFVGGGLSNRAAGEFSAVMGGRQNTAQGIQSIVGGGTGNQAGGRQSGVFTGEDNRATGWHASVGGGQGNEAFGQFAAVPGGINNRAAGLASLAAGQAATAAHNGSFVWSDLSGGQFTTTAPNQFLIRAAGGVGIGTGSPQAALDVVGEVRSTIFTPTSDRNAKENFAPVDPREVLAKVAALPISRWNFKELPGADHFGPMAQDFHAAFGLNGRDDRHIATVDADGVALAAIQGLNQKLDEKSAEVETLKQQNSELLRRLEWLEQKLK
jgi:hypothetical protein